MIPGRFILTLRRSGAGCAVDTVLQILTGSSLLEPGLRYESVNRQWEMAEFDYRPHGWPHARRFCVARRFIADDSTDTLFSMGRHVYRVWVTNMNLTPAGRMALL